VTHSRTFRCAAKYEWALPRAIAADARLTAGMAATRPDGQAAA